MQHTALLPKFSAYSLWLKIILMLIITSASRTKLKLIIGKYNLLYLETISINLNSLPKIYHGGTRKSDL